MRAVDLDPMRATFKHYRTTPARTSSRIRAGADLHIHTTHSDGVCSPCEVVIAAAGVGLAALAITDHDTVSALAAARPEAERLGLELIPGVELTCEHDGREVHVLAHFIRADDPDLLAATAWLRTGRAHRVQLMIDRLGEQGFTIDPDALRGAFPRAVLGRRHLAEYLVRTGQLSSHGEAFARVLGDNRPAFVPPPRLAVHEAIDLIKNAGGVAGLAHPPFNLQAATLRRLVDAGLGAIEVDGPGISNRLGRRFRAWADEFQLVPIAGSDFHAPDRPGRWPGSIVTPNHDLERLRQARAVNRSSEGPAKSVKSS